MKLFSFLSIPVLFLLEENDTLERTLHLAGQNMMTTTVENLRKIFQETFQTDEYFLDEIESILAPFWEELTEEEIMQLLIESFEVFDEDKHGYLSKMNLMEYLTQYGDMPLTKKDFRIIFSMVDNSNQFDYRQFVHKLCSSRNKNLLKYPSF